MTQTVRAVCTGAAADCAHLYQGGAKNTIVRLPESVSLAVGVEETGSKLTRCAVRQDGLRPHRGRVHP